MANRATVIYNGNTILAEEKEGSFAVAYGGSTLATLGAGTSKILNCSGKVMKTNVAVGGRTLNCAGKLMAANLDISVISLFPSEPSAYDLIASYTASQTWTAPENGFFQIEVFGASGNGGSTSAKYDTYGGYYIHYGAGGGGGGGGGYSCSRIKMNKGDTVVLTAGAVGANTSAKINSSLETYSSLQVTSGKNGADGKLETWNQIGGAGGAGGVASGGNFVNSNGNSGSSGRGIEDGDEIAVQGSGGASGYTGGNAGGAGGAPDYRSSYTRTTAGASGKAGFFKIYRGNTNLA